MEMMADARAPWVEFKLIAEEDRAQTEATGAYSTRDIEYVIVTPAGSKDRFESVVSEWFKRKEQDVRDGRLDPGWLNAWKEKYKAWKEGRELPLHGTPIINWPPASPAQKQALIHWKVMTVEALAEANEDVITRLGMGGRMLKQLAIDWIKSSKDIGTVTVQLAKFRADLDNLRAINEELTRKNEELRRLVNAEQVTERGTEASDDLSFLDAKPAQPQAYVKL